MNKVKVWISKCCKNPLFKSSVLGLVFTVTAYYIATRCGLANEILKISIALLTLGIPFFFLWIFRIYNAQKQLSQRVIDQILNNRKISLLGAGFLGLILAFVIYDIATYCCLKPEILKSSITILALGLPTFFILWLFRTHDVQEQLQKTEENTNNSTFFECARLLAAENLDEDKEEDTGNISGTKTAEAEDLDEDKRTNRIKNSLPKRIALEQLAYLKRETSFDKKKINLLTSYAQLSGIDLSSANLEQVTLMKADLRGANLRNTILIKADLGGADLRGADLRGADLRNTILITAKLSEAKLDGAYYNGETDFRFTDYSEPAARKKAKLKLISLHTQNPLCLITDDKAELSKIGLRWYSPKK